VSETPDLVHDRNALYQLFTLLILFERILTAFVFVLSLVLHRVNDITFSLHFGAPASLRKAYGYLYSAPIIWFSYE
jgi:hypothetical protein